nr:PREDICTED: uncharacterized protein LOC109044171 isoform X1 [Bemisia tabaci]
MSLRLNLKSAFLQQKSNVSFCKKCSISTYSAVLNKMREGRFLNKLMGHSKKRRRTWQPDVAPSNNVMGEMLKRSVGKQHMQRLSVLNHMFMENITDYLSSCELSEKLAEFNLEISEVKISVDLNFLNVYWSSTARDSHDTIQAELENIAFPLRNELSRLQVMGSVPRIIFIRDEKSDSMAIIDDLLRKADYGEDFVPSDATLFQGIELPKSAEVLEFEASEAGKKAAEERLQESRRTEVDRLMALQKHNVFNLDQGAIMGRIKAAVEKSRAPHRKHLTYGEIPTEPKPEESLAEITAKIKALTSTEVKDFMTERRKAALKDQRLLMREEMRTPDQRIKESDLDERIREEFADDYSNYDFRDSDDHR